MKQLWVVVVGALTLAVVCAPVAGAQESGDGQAAPDGSVDEATQAADGFIDAVRNMFDTVIELTEPGTVDRAEGLRHVIRLVEMQNSRATDDLNPDHPMLFRCGSINCKLGMDNPDFTYQNIEPISAEHVYRISGTRGTVPYITMQIFEGALGGDVLMSSEDLVVGDDSTFEIILSATEPEDAQNWMELRPNASAFLVRQGHNDWTNDREATMEVEVLNSPVGQYPPPVPVVTTGEFATDMAGLNLRLNSFLSIMQDARNTWPNNAMNQPSSGAFGIANAGSPRTIGSVGTYDIGEDEALVIEMTDQGAVHGGIQLGNFWLESLDYRTRQTSLNWHQSVADSDGVYRYVLSHADPGTPNWLDISGHEKGSIFVRWQEPPTDDFAPPVVKVVPLEELAGALPADHPEVSPEERDETLRLRGLAVNQRRNGYVGDPSAGADGTSDGSGDADSDTDASANPDAEADDAPDGETDADGESNETAASTPEVDATDGDDDGGLSGGVIAAVIGIPLAAAGGWFAGRRKAG